MKSLDTDRILAWLAANPDSTVTDIAAATGLGGQCISARLVGAEKAGRAHRDREHGAAPWRWRTRRTGGTRS